jgi:putative glutamine amidotransferase
LNERNGDGPVIGITAAPRTSVVVDRELPTQTVTEFFVQTLIQAGAEPVILPVHGSLSDAVLDRLDAVALTGGGDIDPTIYGQDPRPAIYGLDPVRDRFEIELVRRAIHRDLPLMAVCRGHQVLNVALGGSLVQDLAAQRPHSLAHWQGEPWEQPSHAVTIEPDSRLAALVGPELAVNSMHHQAIDEPASDLRPAARAPDGVIEAVEVADRRFVLGLQWHPEYLGADHPGFTVVKAFVDAARSSQR